MQFTVRGVAIAVTPLILIAVVLGLGIAGYGGYDYVQQSNVVDDAVAVETSITDTEISRSEGRRLYYRVTVEHTYQYQGSEYTSERVFPGLTRPIYTVRNDAQNVIKPYESTTTATAYVDPDDPSGAFLKRQTTFAPFKFVGFGGLVALLTTLHAIGARNPGQSTGLRPTSDRKPTRYETLFGVERNAVYRLSKRLMLTTPVVFLVSLVATVALLFTSGPSTREVRLTDPIGLTLISAFVAVLGFVCGLVLYAIWSFTEYGRLRERIPDPRPPSPFRHPSRLVTILYTREGLDAYGRRVKLTAFTLTAIGFLVGVFVFIFLTAA